MTVQELADLLCTNIKYTACLSVTSAAASTFFLGCKLHKADGFPLLYIEKNSSIIHLDSDAAMYWVTNMGNWAASH